MHPPSVAVPLIAMTMVLACDTTVLSAAYAGVAPAPALGTTSVLGEDVQSPDGPIADSYPDPDRITEMRRAWVRHHGSGGGASSETATCAAAAKAGGVVIAGTFNSQPITVRFNAAGAVQWADVYVDRTRQETVPVDVEVDALENTYVILRTRAASDEEPWVTVIKYTSTGQRAWVTSHPGLYKASAVNEGGGVYLGLSWNPSGAPNRYGTSDYVLVHVGASGRIEWRREYDGPWGGGDYISALGRDAAGNIYVSGLAFRNPYNYSVATLKFDSTGSMQWLQLYGYIVGGWSGVPQVPLLMSVDPGGDITIALAQPNASASELLRYDPEGREKWVRQYSGKPHSLCAGSSGSVYFETTAALMHIDASGSTQWSRTSDGRALLYVESDALYVGSVQSGRLVVTSYDSAGAIRWTLDPVSTSGASDALAAIVGDGRGQITVAGTRTITNRGTDIIGRTCTSSGTILRILQYDGPALSSDRVAASCVDKDGYTYVTGKGTAGNGQEAFVLVKYDPSGNEVFARADTLAPQRAFRPMRMSVDGSGRIRIAGQDQGGGMALICFSPSGASAWKTTLSVDMYESSVTMATDAQGRTIVCGHYANAAVVMESFGPDGFMLWKNTYTKASYQSLFDIGFDTSGNAYLATTVARGGANTAVLVKYSPSGSLLWEKVCADVMTPIQGNGTQEFAGLAVDPSGRCIVAAKNVRASDGLNNLLVLRFATTGLAEWWATACDGFRSVYPVTVVRGSRGEYSLTGQGSIRDYGSFNFLLRYDESGRLLSRADIPVQFPPEAAVVDQNGSTHLACRQSSYRLGEDTDIYTLSYGPSGSMAWMERFDAFPGSFDWASGIGVHPDGGVTTIGYSEVPIQDGPPRETGSFFTVIHYTPLKAPGSLVDNPGFESEMRSWVCNTNGSCTATTVSSGESSPRAAEITVVRPDSNITFYQPGIFLQPNASYRLTFSARSNTGHNVAVSLVKHTEPNQTYGLSDFVCDLGREWTSFTVDFMTLGFTQLVTDGRIMFRFPGLAEAGDVYQFDNVVLERLGEPTELRTVRHPSDVEGGIGQRVMFRVDVPDDDAWVQWQKNGADIPRANLRMFSPPPLMASDSGTTYSCRVTWPAGVLQTRAARMIVRPSPISFVPNHRFDEGTKGWAVAPADAATFAVDGSTRIARLTVHRADDNLQLMATGVQLRQGVTYRLQFRARSASGHDVGVGFVKHTPPFTPYVEGLRTIPLTREWTEHSTMFAVSGAPGVVADARMMFWYSPYAAEGDEYEFYDVLLEEYITGSTTEVESEGNLAPLTFSLEQNYPNPFNPETTIFFTLAERDHIRLTVYDVLGREVARLVDENRGAGRHAVQFNATGLASGVYIYRLETPSQVTAKRMVMVR